MARKNEAETTVSRETDTDVTRSTSEESGSGQKTAPTLREAIYGNADAEAKAKDDLATAEQDAYKEAAQAELDAQQKDRDEGYATSAEEGPSKMKPAEDAGDAEADA